MVTVYQYPSCSSCKKALKWLRAHDVSLREVDISERPPSTSVLKNVMRLSGLPLKKLFNTSGQAYRDGDFKRVLPTLSDAEALAALAGNGMLIRRPIVIGDGFALVGFHEDEYAQAMG